MTRPLGTAPSNPRLGTPEHGEPQRTHHEAGDGGAAPSDWATAWLTLANRLVDWHQAVTAENATPEFDSDDQARLA